MTITREESDLLDKRDTMSADEQYIIEQAIYSIRTDAKRLGVPLANDDRACQVEAAIIRYLLESR